MYKRQVRERILAEIQKAAPSKSGVQTLHLICIGIDQYMDSNTYPLDGAVNDANQISHYLESNASDAFEFQSRLILNQQATKAGILSAINDLSQQAVDGDIDVYKRQDQLRKGYISFFEKIHVLKPRGTVMIILDEMIPFGQLMC